MEFKDKVFAVRMKLGLSQEGLARALGVGYVTLNRWENGVTKPNKMKLYAFNEFCKEKGITLEDNKRD